MYRIYTEDKSDMDTELATRIVADYFVGFTVYRGKGYWDSKPENALIFEIATSNADMVNHVARLLKAVLKQEAVLIVNTPTEDKLV